MIYLSSFTLPDAGDEDSFVDSEKRTCFNTFYPFLIFPKMELEELEFEPITIFYGGNGTGKSTLLNVIAEKLKLNRNAVFNKTNFFDDYISFCDATITVAIPAESRIITSDDVFDYILDIRNLNNGITEFTINEMNCLRNTSTINTLIFNSGLWMITRNSRL